MFCFLATEAHELPLSTSLSILYFSIINFEVDFCLWTTYNILSTFCDQSTHSKKGSTNCSKMCLYVFQCNVFEFKLFFVFYLGSHCFEVLLKRIFLLMRPKKLILLSKSLTHLGSQLNEVFLV